MPSFFVPEGANQIVLRFPWSSRAWVCLLLLLGLVLLASAFLGEFDLLERIGRGLAGLAATLGFTVLLVWNLSFNIRADHEGLVSSSILGSTRIAWNDIGALEGKTVSDERIYVTIQGRQELRKVRTIAKYLVVHDRAAGAEIKIRDDLAPSDGRTQLIEMLHAALAEGQKEGEAEGQ